MTVAEHGAARSDPLPAGFTGADLERAVRLLLADERAAIEAVAVRRLPGGLGAGTSVSRVSGRARSGGGEARPWSLVVKHLSDQALDFQSSGDEPQRWDYWKREWHAYRSGWQQRLGGPLRAARCLLTSPADANTSGRAKQAWIVLEDLGPQTNGFWEAGSFRHTAAALAAFGASERVLADAHSETWLARDWLHGWVHQSAPFVDRLEEAVRHPDAGRVITPEIADDLRQAWTERHQLLAELGDLPQLVSHNDVFPRNVFWNGSDLVAIDWAFCGLAPVGQELTGLVGGSQIFGYVPIHAWERIEQVCLDAYADALTAAGPYSREQVIAGYVLSSALRFGAGSLAPALGLILSGGHRALIESTFGCRYDEFILTAANVIHFHLRHVHEARRLLGLPVLGSAG